MAFACILCGGADGTVTRVKDAKDGAPLDIAMCQTCGHLQLAEVMSEDELNAFYRDTYRATYRKAAAPKPRHVYRAGKVARARRDVLDRYIAPGARHLDIGAGGGEFTYLMSRAGHDAAGIDPASGYLEHGRAALGVDLQERTLQQVEGAAIYDAITLFHVLEHLPAPAHTMADVARLLRPGGIFFVEVPNIEAKSLSPANLYFKAHISYFTEPALRQIAEPGFEVLEVQKSRVLRMILRKRAAPQDDPARIAALRGEAVTLMHRRLHDRGFAEYLMNGGLFSPVRSLSRILEEARETKGKTAKDILDRFA